MTLRSLASYIGVRLVQGAVVVLGALLVSYVLVNALGNPVHALTGVIQLDHQQMAELTRRYGFDKPFVPRFFDYAAGAVQGDFGASFRSQDSALSLVMAALPKTLVLVAASIGLALLIAIPVSIFSVLRRESLADRALRRSFIVAQGVPDFWLALLLVLLLSVQLRWLPGIDQGNLKSLVLPVLALAIPLLATLVRVFRGCLLDVLTPDFVTAMRTRGLSTRDFVIRHAVPNALPPLITFLALQVGWLLGGTLVIEIIFGRPGIGALAVQATRNDDLPVIEAIIVVTAVAFVLLSLLADLLLFAIDPRIRIRTS